MPRLASPCRFNNGGKASSARTGTARAIISSSNVHGHFTLCAVKAKHGGARNTSNRTSNQLSEKQIQAIFAAVAKASAIGLPLNRHWTVHWSKAGLTDDQACAATTTLLTLVRDWLRKQGNRFACVWVRENDHGDRSKGSHVHILLHVPAELRWCGWRNRRWLVRVTGRPYVAGTGRTRIIGGSRTAPKASPDVFAANLAVVTAYIAKVAPFGVLRALGLDRHGERGTVIGKRWGRSAAIGRLCTHPRP